MKKKIANYNYEVDENGVVYNLTTGKRIRQSLNRDGYVIVYLWKDNKPKAKTVHRLVALAFIENPENKPCVNHKDGVKHHNFVENLEWSTYSENTKHSFDNGLQIPLKGSEISWSNFTEEQIHEVCKLMQDGFRNVEIEEKTGLPRWLMKNVRTGKNWTHVSHLYNIPKRSRIVSEETIRWICWKLQEGVRICDIVKESTNPKVNKSLVRKIKIKELYTDISNQYEF